MSHSSQQWIKVEILGAPYTHARQATKKRMPFLRVWFLGLLKHYFFVMSVALLLWFFVRPALLYLRCNHVATTSSRKKLQLKKQINKLFAHTQCLYHVWLWYRYVHVFHLFFSLYWYCISCVVYSILFYMCGMVPYHLRLSNSIRIYLTFHSKCLVCQLR